jgi:hypothetical protein
MLLTSLLVLVALTIGAAAAPICLPIADESLASYQLGLVDGALVVCVHDFKKLTGCWAWTRNQARSRSER